MLLSRSCALSTRSFSSFRASRSALVSRRGSRTGSRSDGSPPLMLRKDRSCLLPLPLRVLYTLLPVLSCDGATGADAVGEVGRLALERRVWPLDAGLDSFPWVLPMLRQRCKDDGDIKQAAEGAGLVMGDRIENQVDDCSVSWPVPAGLRSLSRGLSEWMVVRR